MAASMRERKLAALRSKRSRISSTIATGGVFAESPAIRLLCRMISSRANWMFSWNVGSAPPRRRDGRDTPARRARTHRGGQHFGLAIARAHSAVRRVRSQDTDERKGVGRFLTVMPK